MRKGEERRKRRNESRKRRNLLCKILSSPKLEYHTDVFAWRWCLQKNTLTRFCKSKSKFCMDGTIQDSTANEVYR